MKRKKNGTLVKGKINYLLQLLHIQRWQLSDTKTIFFSFLQSRVRCPLSQLVVINAVKEYKVDIMHEDLKKKKQAQLIIERGGKSRYSLQPTVQPLLSSCILYTLFYVKILHTHCIKCWHFEEGKGCKGGRGHRSRVDLAPARAVSGH